MLENKMETRAAADQNALDVFSGRWASMIEEVAPGLKSGLAPMFGPEDPRPTMAAQHLGYSPNSLSGMKVLELGPLEGAHTYQLSRLGADSIVSVESNSEAYLKCLIVKEILQTPRCRFLLGDCLEFLRTSLERFDLIFCSGILYHMEDPFELVKAIAARTDRVFVWSHYFDPAVPLVPERSSKPVSREGVPLTYYEHVYGNRNYDRFWGGIAPTASWMSKTDIEKCFTHFDFRFSVLSDVSVHPGGPNLYAVASRG